MAMTDADKIRNLVASYALAADSRNAPAWAALFAADGALLLGGQAVGRGPAELEAWFSDRPMPAGYHMIANLKIEIDGDTATGIANFVAVHDAGLGARGMYRAKFMRRNDGWAIAEWCIEVA